MTQQVEFLIDEQVIGTFTRPGFIMNNNRDCGSGLTMKRYMASILRTI